jgi:hypothetical protein
MLLAVVDIGRVAKFAMHHARLSTILPLNGVEVFPKKGSLAVQPATTMAEAGAGECAAA